MTKAELEHIQAVCHEWLRQSGAQDSRKTIPSSSLLSRAVELKIKSLLTFDNVLITSVIDAETGTCYTKLVARSGDAGEFFDTPFESIAPATLSSPSEPPKTLTATRKRYEEAMALLSDSERADSNESAAAKQASMDFSYAPETISQSVRNASEASAKFLLYTNQKLLGYSLLERARSKHERRGKFHPSEDYFDHAEIFAALPAAENDCLEANAQEAYGLLVDGAQESRDRFNELTAAVEALQLYVNDEAGQRIDDVEIRLEDLSRHYDDETERWLCVTFPDRLQA